MSRNGDNGSPRRPILPPLRQVKKQPPQKTVDDFWSAFTTKYPGKVHNILPKNPYARSKAAKEPKGTVYGHGAHESYEDAKTECIASVEKIAKECRRVNMRYRDPHFDIEWDLKSRKRDCLDGLLLYPDAGKPKSVKRVHQIFENPQFYVDGATAGDVRQGRAGDCWFLAALGALGNKKDLIERVCVSRDEAVGVYGFVFYRDGDWISTVIDDKLYLSVPDWDESLYEKVQWLQIPNRQDAEEEYRKVYQTGSRALYFAQCNTENETWLPLLEKAYAKAHGDYYAIDGGFTGEAIEDLTGGVTTEIFTSDILDIDQFWKEELLRVNDEFLFGCATGRFDDWQGGGQLTDRKGIESGHAYSIMEAREINNERLLKVRNPWGETEWTGPWSDGSEQWTAEWMQLLDHKFGDDGVFWISYKDLLRKYQFFDRTRLFGPEWSITQQWTSVDVPWSADYNDIMFSFSLTKGTPIVIVLSQLDDRYWDGLQGQYNFSLHFRISKDGEDDYIVRSHGNYSMTRSVSTELELGAGCYTVRMRITATRYQKRPTVEDVIQMNCKTRQEKLLQIGMSYDLAHAKGLIQETEEEKERKAEKEAKDKAATKLKVKEEAKKRKYQEWLRHKKAVERTRREKGRLSAHRKRKEEQRRSEIRIRQEPADANGTGGFESAAFQNGAAVSVQDRLPATGSTPTKAQALGENGVRADESNPRIARDIVASPATSMKVEFNTSRISEDGIKAVEKEFTPSNHKFESVNVRSTPTNEVDEVDQGLSRMDAVANIGKKQDKTQDEIGQPDQGPSSKDPSPPAVKVNAEESVSQVLPTPPPSPGFLDRRSEASEPETVVTFASSIDTDLDERFFDDDLRDNAYRDGSVIIAEVEADGEDDDLEEYSSDPWNAVCVVGLRLYTKEGEASVKVLRPQEDDEKEVREETPLDVDDPMRSMSDEPVTPSSPLKEKQTAASESIAERLARQVPKPRSFKRRSGSVAA